MTMTDYAKYFQPEILSRIERLELRARHVVEGFVSGMHKSPYKGFSVEFAEHREAEPEVIGGRKQLPRRRSGGGW